MAENPNFNGCVNSESPHCATWLPRELRETWENLSPEEREAVQKWPPPLTDQDIEEIRLKHPLTEAHPLERFDSVKLKSPSTPEFVPPLLQFPRIRRRTQTVPVTPTPRPRKAPLKNLLHFGGFRRSSPEARSSIEDASFSQQLPLGTKTSSHQHPEVPIAPLSSTIGSEARPSENIEARKTVGFPTSSDKARRDEAFKAMYEHMEYETPGPKFNHMEYEASGPKCNLVEQGLVLPPIQESASAPTPKRSDLLRRSTTYGNNSIHDRHRGTSSKSTAGVQSKCDEAIGIALHEPALPSRNPRPPPRTFDSIFRRFNDEAVQHPSEWPLKSVDQCGLPASTCLSSKEADPTSPPNISLGHSPTRSPTPDQSGNESLFTASDCKRYVNRGTALALAWSGRIPGRPEMDVCLVFTRFLAHRMAECETHHFSDLARVDIAFKWLRRYGSGEGLLFKTNEYPVTPKRGFGFFIAPLWMQETHRYDVLELIKRNAFNLFNANVYQNRDLIAHNTGLHEIVTSLLDTLSIFQVSLILVGTNADITLCHATDPSRSASFRDLPDTLITHRSDSVAAHIILSGPDDVQIFDVQNCLLTRHNDGVITKFNVCFYAGIAVFVAGHPVAVIEMLDLKRRKVPLDRAVIHEARNHVQDILQEIYCGVRPVTMQRDEKMNRLHSMASDLSDTALEGSGSVVGAPATARKLKASKSMEALKEGLKKKFIGGYGDEPLRPPLSPPPPPSPPAPSTSFFDWSEDEQQRRKGKYGSRGKNRTWP